MAGFLITPGTTRYKNKVVLTKVIARVQGGLSVCVEDVLVQAVKVTGRANCLVTGQGQLVLVTGQPF